MQIIFSTFMRFSGELAAISAALFWAISSFVFRKLGKSIRPTELNIIKGVGAILLLLMISLFLKESPTALTPFALMLLLVSGALGIGFGDTMYFEALNSIGPRRTLLISILAPPMTVVLAILFLGERINPLGWLGVLITLFGVAWVILGNPNKEEPQKVVRMGVFFAFLSALAQAIGSVMSRWALTQTPVSAVQSAILRLVAGIAFLAVWMLIGRQKPAEWLKETKNNAGMFGILALGILLGAFLPLWLQQISFKNTEVGIAQTLLATSPLFVLLIAALRKEKLAAREIIGMVIAVAGIAVLFLA
ncbi:MAG: DMT family transporter [Anaerolineaceae bacterium]|nr:DMT family transporter [Anaerolineaceae bacterium]